MLTLNDYADILSADPFVTQTLVLAAETSNYVCHQNAGNGAYGVNLDPNDSESSVLATPPTINPYTLGQVACTSSGGTYSSGSCSWPTDFCGTPATSSATTIAMQRFDPFDSVQYPEPGINGEPQTYAGTLSYQTTSTAGQSTESTSTAGLGVNYSATIGADDCAVTCVSLDFRENNTWSWGDQYSTTDTSQTGSTATYNVVGPQLTDNYQGPTTFNVYKDNVFGTFAFYSDLQRENPPLQLSGAAGAPSVPPNGLVSSQSPITIQYPTTNAFTTSTTSPSFGSVQVGGAPATAWVQVTNNSPNWMTMPGPAITFSDQGFQVVPPAANSGINTDSCSNQLLAPVGTMSSTPFAGTVAAVIPLPSNEIYTFYCFVEVQFNPVVSDAPNSLGSPYAVTSSLVASGTENITSYQNILVTSTGNTVSGTATPGGTNTGATLLPTSPSAPGINFYAFGTSPETFTFTNLNSNTMTIASILLTDSSDFTITYPTSKGCTAGATVSTGQYCSFILAFNGHPTDAVLQTGITAMGTITGGTTVVGALAGAGASGVVPGVPEIRPTSTPANFSDGANCASQSLSGATVTLTNNGYGPVTITGLPLTSGTAGCNSGGYSSVTLSSCSGSISPGASCTVSASGTFESPNTTLGGGCVQLSGEVQAANSTGSADTTNVTTPPVFYVAWGNGSCGSLAVPITIHGAEQSTTVTVPATAAAASLTVQPVAAAAVAKSTSAASSSTSGPAPSSGPAPAPVSPSANLTVAVKIGAFETTVKTPAGSTTAVIAQAIERALNVLNSPVRATVSGAVVSLTSYTKGSAANLALSVTGNQDYAVLTSGSTLTGGVNATTTTKYDAGSVTLTTNGVTASTQWGQSSTAATVARALAASVNQVASTYWTASASGDVVTLNSVSTSSSTGSSSARKSATAASAPSISISDTGGFSPASFEAVIN